MPAAWFVQGTAFHSTVEEWEVSGRSFPESVLHEVYLSHWNTEMDKYLTVEPDTSKWQTGGRVKPEDDIPRRRERGWEQVKGYVGYSLANSEWRILQLADGDYAIEYPFDMTLGEVRIIGSIDQIVEHVPTGRLMVRDLKTGSKLPSTPLQLGVYDLAIEQDWGFRTGWGDFYMAKNNAPTEPYDLSHYSLELVSDWFHKLEAGIKNEVFIPNPGDACRTCGVSQFCSAVGTDQTYNRKAE